MNQKGPHLKFCNRHFNSTFPMKKTLAILAATFLLIGLTRAQTTVGTGTNQLGPTVAGNATQGVLLEYWTNLNGVTVAAMSANTNYPLNPNGVELWADFEGPTNRGALYGERLRAWVVPPVSGAYTFWIASDDNGELWLSPDDNPAHKQLIADVPYWTGFHEWTKFPQQCSATITLSAGQGYYIEALHYQGQGPANLSVGWQQPGVTNVQVISGTYLTVEFTLSTTNRDKYLLKLEGAQNQRRSSVSAFDVILSVDGESLGHHVLTGP